MRTLLIAAAVAAAVTPCSAALDAAALTKVLGRPVVENKGEFKVSVPRADLEVTLDGFRLTPPMGLTAWMAFAPHGDEAMLMGDLVLLETELPRVQKAAVEAGLSVSGVHNHFLRETPKMIFMHVGAVGKPDELARAARKTLDSFAPPASAKSAPVASALDDAALDAILGHAGAAVDGAHRIVVGRPDIEIRHGGAGVDAFMGLNTWMAFQGSPEKAAVAGDFAMLDAEVPGVVRALVSRGIVVTAVHNHMIGETPRTTFLHFWGVGPAAGLAKALRAALDETGTGRKKP